MPLRIRTLLNKDENLRTGLGRLYAHVSKIN